LQTLPETPRRNRGVFAIIQASKASGASRVPTTLIFDIGGGEKKVKR